MELLNKQPAPEDKPLVLKTRVVNDRKIVYTECEIEWQGKKEVVLVKKLSFGEMLDLNQASAKMSYEGGQPRFTLDQKAMSEYSLLKGILEAPFTVNKESIRELDNETGQFLLTVFNRLNAPSDKKKED